MSLEQFILIIVILQVKSDKCPDTDYTKMSKEDANLLEKWNVNNPEPAWEFSGQYQGDIVLTRTQRNGLINKTKHWSNGRIPYEFASNFDPIFRLRVAEVLRKGFSQTCVTPVLRRRYHTDYVLVTSRNTGCWSYVGRKGGCQVLNLDAKHCNVFGTIIHEFLHAAGFYHQHSATDRNDYVTIFWENIREGKTRNFLKYRRDVVSNFGQKYDYKSVMHYGPRAFSSNKLPTIVPKDPRATIGQRHTISEIDIYKLNKMYNCI